MDYPTVDRILDDFNKILKALQVQYNLPDAKIERWRWDMPQISLSWLAQDAIWRTINVLVRSDGNAQGYFTCQIEVNAWQDIREANRWIRRWRHQSIYEGIVDDLSSSRQYDDIFLQSYQTVTHWNHYDLKEEQLLSPAAAELLEQQHSSRFTPTTQQSSQSPRRSG
jgi:hypothetical protein